MTVIVESNSLKVSSALRQFVTHQARKIFKLQKGVVQLRVFLETIAKKQNDPQANQVTYHVAVPGKDVVVKKRATDMYDAIVSATDASARQLRKVYERRRSLARA